MTSSPHNMRIPDDLWELVVAEANERATHIRQVDPTYARYPRTRVVIDALEARYASRRSAPVENLTPAWGTPVEPTLVPCEAFSNGPREPAPEDYDRVREMLAERPVESNRNSNPPPDPRHTSWH